MSRTLETGSVEMLAELTAWLDNHPDIITTDEKAALVEWLEGYEEEFAECRDVGHDKATYQTFRLSPNWYGRRFVCRRCGYSYDQIVHRGRVVETFNREYKTGYTKPENVPAGHIARAVFREMVLLRSSSTAKPPPEILAAFEFYAGEDVEQ